MDTPERPRPLGNERPDPLLPAYPQIAVEESEHCGTPYEERPEIERPPADDEQPEEEHPDR